MTKFKLFLIFQFLIASLILRSEEVKSNSKHISFHELIDSILMMQQNSSEVEYRPQTQFFQYPHDKIKDPNHPLIKTLKSCFKQNLQSSKIVFNEMSKLWKDCEEKIKALKLPFKKWKIVIDSLPFKQFGKEKLELLSKHYSMTLPREQDKNLSTLSTARASSQMVLLNHSLPVNKEPYQYLGSTVIISYLGIENLEIEIRNTFRINKKIEALLKIDPPLSLELSTLIEQTPHLTANYFFKLDEFELKPKKLVIYPGIIFAENEDDQIKSHQLVLRQIQESKVLITSQIEEIEFDYMNQAISTKGKNIPEVVNNLLIEALQMQTLISPARL